MAGTNPKLRLTPFDPVDDDLQVVTVTAPSIRDSYDENFARPVDFVSTWAEPRPPRESAGAYSTGIPSTLPAPPLDIENPPEILVEAPRIPLEDLTDAELLEIGTDSALYELDQRRGVPESQRAFVPDPRFLPMVAPAVEVIATWLRAIPLFGLLIPGPGGQSDETLDLPLDFRAPPNRPPPRFDAPLDPIMPPNWAEMVDWDIFGVYQPLVPLIEDPYVRPIGDPVRRTAPVPIGPGVFEPFDDPIAVPELQPFRTPEPYPFSVPAPFVVPANPTDPFVIPRRIADPIERPTERPVTVPGVPDPFQFPIPDPVTVAPPRLDPPRVVAPPNPFTNPWDTLNPTQDPFRDPLPFDFPQPQRADPCDCSKVKEKKKPKKKKQPRAVCYSGTYKESRYSTSKTPRKQVPCSTPPKKPKLDSGSKRGSSIAPAIPFLF